MIFRDIFEQLKLRMASESRKALACLSVLLLVAIVGVTVFVGKFLSRIQ